MRLDASFCLCNSQSMNPINRFLTSFLKPFSLYFRAKYKLKFRQQKSIKIRLLKRPFLGPSGLNSNGIRQWRNWIHIKRTELSCNCSPVDNNKYKKPKHFLENNGKLFMINLGEMHNRINSVRCRKTLILFFFFAKHRFIKFLSPALAVTWIAPLEKRFSRSQICFQWECPFSLLPFFTGLGQ